MHLVQEGGGALHFVQDDHAIARDVAQLEREQPGVGQKRLMPRFVEEIDDVRAGEGVSRPRALAHAADAKEEEAAFRRDEQASVTRGCHDAVILRREMTE